jgi:choline kinase
VISAAGMGTRLGMSMPKALVELRGKPILTRQLEMLADVADVVIVAGYRSQLVLDLLRTVRPSARVALNHEFTSTGTAASLVKGAALARDWIVSLDGDLLVRPEDLQAVLAHPGPCLGVIPTRSTAPVHAELDGDEMVVDLSQERETKWEWSGLAKIEREVALSLGRRHVFSGLVPHLPIRAIAIDCVEIDDLDDLEYADRWVAGHEREGERIAR